MSDFRTTLGTPVPIHVKLDSTDATDIAGSDDNTVYVSWFQCTEIAGDAPDLTVEHYDGSTSAYLRKGAAMTAREGVLFDQGFALNKGDRLRVTAGAADQIDVVGMAYIGGTLA